MQKNRMYFEMQKVKIYKDSYRPSSNLLHFLRGLLSVILIGRSPAGHNSFYQTKK